jgi:D-sedoheptulose 7-phosphate isomerase
MPDELKSYWMEMSDAARAMPLDDLRRVAEMLMDAHARDVTIFILGNGGSASTASHFACDLAKGTQVDGVTPFRVVCLTDNVPLLTAWANDTSYERVFAEQLSTLVRRGDLVMLISGSGNSENVLAAARAARRARAATIALTGKTGGRLKELVDHAVCVPSPAIDQVEDLHLAIVHSLCRTIREQLRFQHEASQQSVAPIRILPALHLSDEDARADAFIDGGSIK